MNLDIAEIFHESGELQYRYSRYLANDRHKWVRHGLFTAFHRNGERASESTYVDNIRQLADLAPDNNDRVTT